MSIKLMSAVWGMKLNHTDKLVLLALADNANDDGVCWPSIRTICKKTCLSERGVQASLQRLIETNTLQRIIRNGRSSNFYVRPPQDMHPAEYAPTPASRAPQPPQDMHPGGAPYAPRTINEPSDEPSKKHHGAYLVDFEEFWKAYPRHVAKQNALAAYTKARKGGTAHEAIITGTRRYADECRGREQRYIAHAASWLNSGRWDDAPGANRDTVNGSKPNGGAGSNRQEPKSRAELIAELISELPEGERSSQGTRIFEDTGSPDDHDRRPIILEGAL